MLSEFLAEKLDAATRAKRDGNDRDQSYFHPSTVGYCPRKTVMERLQVPKPPHEERLQRIFDNGHGVHERIQAELKAAGVLVLDEVRVEAPDHNLYGHTDGIGKLYVPGKGGVMVILEIKSAGAKSFHWIAGGGEKGYRANGPDKKHVWQVQLYMYTTGIPYAIIIYECKDHQERAYFTIKRDVRLVEDVLFPRVDLVNRHVELGSLPPRDEEHQPKAGKACFDCTYCDYKRVCEAEESAEGVIDLVALGAELLAAA